MAVELPKSLRMLYLLDPISINFNFLKLNFQFPFIILIQHDAIYTTAHSNGR